MQRVIGLFLMFSFVVVGQAYSAVLVLQPGGTYTTKTTLSQAATAADTAGKTVVVTSPQVVTTAIAWPLDRELTFSRSGYITFTGSGALTGLKESRPEWFGTNATPGTTDMLTAIRAAVASTSGRVLFQPDIYYVSGEGNRNTDGIEFKSNLVLQGVPGKTEIRAGSAVANLFRNQQGVIYTNVSQVPKNITIAGIRFTKPNAIWDNDLENTGLLNASAVDGLTITQCEFVGWSGDAIMLGFMSDLALTDFMQTYVRRVSIHHNFFDGVTKDNRQAISIWDGVDVAIHHNHFTRTTRGAASGYAMPGAIDIEPVRAYHRVADIRVDNNTFDDIGGSVGVVSFAVGADMTTAAYGFYIRNNIFKNITNNSDIFVLGKAAPDHTALATGSPYNVVISANDHVGSTTSRRWFVGGVGDLTIANETVTGYSPPALLGHEDLANGNNYPIVGFRFINNKLRGWMREGNIYAGILTVNGGLIGAQFSGNEYNDCGNLSSGVPTNMTVLEFSLNGLASKNVDITNERYVNNGVFAADSFPVYAGTLTNPSTFNYSGNTYHGFNAEAYNSVYSIRAQANGDYYQGFITILSTGTPSVVGGQNFIANTGDTLTDLTGGKEGQIIQIIAETSGCVLTHGTNIFMKAAANLTLYATGTVTNRKTITLINRAGKWYEI